MQRAAVLIIVGGLSACGSFMPTPAMWNPTSGGVDCSTGLPVKATAFAVVAGLLGAVTLAGGDQPSPQTYNQYGYPTSLPSPDAGVDHAISYALIGAGAVGAAVATIAWASHAQCTDLDSQMHALTAASDCATIMRIDADLSATYPRFHDAVINSFPGVALCVAKEPSKPVTREPEVPVPPRDPCIEKRRADMIIAQRVVDPNERARILTNLPTCAPSP